MLVHNCAQGSGEWLQLRCGIPTASEFDNIITPTGKPSKAAERYMFALLAERIMGHPRIESVSTWMDRGSQMEAEAVSFYELQRDCETVKVGFVSNDERTIGASPDRFVGDDGLLEIKVPAEHTHVSYLLKKAVDQAYYPQVQGQLWITGRKWADILSYHPEMPPALIRVERDEEFIAILSKAVSEFSDALEEMALELIERGWITKAARIESPWDDLEVSDEDAQPSSAPGGTEAGFTSVPPQTPPADAPPNPQPGDNEPPEDGWLDALDTPGLAQNGAASPLSPEKGSPAPPERATGQKRVSRTNPAAGDFREWIEAAASAKKELGEENYYSIMRACGFEHANLIKKVTSRQKVRNSWIAAFRALKAKKLAEQPPDAWTAQMLALSDKDPEAFRKKMCSLGFLSVAAVPMEYRQGVLETMRLLIR